MNSPTNSHWDSPMSSSNEVVFPPLVSKLEPPKTSLIARVGLDEPEDDEEERRIAQLNKKVFKDLKKGHILSLKDFK